MEETIIYNEVRPCVLTPLHSETSSNYQSHFVTIVDGDMLHPDSQHLPVEGIIYQILFLDLHTKERTQKYGSIIDGKMEYIDAEDVKNLIDL